MNTGGPAFPRNILDHGHGVITTHESGMTLRDYFAAQAMSAFIDYREWQSTVLQISSLAAENAYVLADAMLEARKR